MFNTPPDLPLQRRGGVPLILNPLLLLIFIFTFFECFIKLTQGTEAEQSFRYILCPLKIIMTKNHTALQLIWAVIGGSLSLFSSKKSHVISKNDPTACRLVHISSSEENLTPRSSPALCGAGSYLSRKG